MDLLWGINTFRYDVCVFLVLRRTLSRIAADATIAMFQSTLWLDRICHHFLLDDKLRGGKLTLSKIEIL